MLPTIEWRDTEVVMIDQRKLPGEEIYVHCKTAAEVARAIKTMVIRGAPAIGVSAAMGLALGVKTSKVTGTQKLAAEFYKMCELMAGTRPTAVNLFWAIDRMKGAFAAGVAAGSSLVTGAEARITPAFAAVEIGDRRKWVCSRPIGGPVSNLDFPISGIYWIVYPRPVRFSRRPFRNNPKLAVLRSATEP